MNKWDFPEALRRLQEGPHVMRRRTSEEEILAAISEEMQRQHDAIQAILGVGLVAREIEKKERLDRYFREGFAWHQVTVGRQFRHLTADGAPPWRVYTITAVEEDSSGKPRLIVGWAQWGAVRSEIKYAAEAFVASFGGWVDEEQVGRVEVAGADG
jgi:hypothetical protein